jgi:CRISPR-associated protein Csx3
MTSPTTSSLNRVSSRSLTLAGQSGFNLVELRNASSLVAQFLPSGALFALRHGPTLLNQLLPGPAEDGLFRLLLRRRSLSAAADGVIRLMGAGVPFSAAGTLRVQWEAGDADLHCTTEFSLDPSILSWRWHVRVTNRSAHALAIDVLHAQDLGLADEGAVRNNEAYTSQYIDLLPLHDDDLGWTVLARQNQAATQGRFPWLALACAPGAVAYGTDGTQFFGADHRLTGEPAAVRKPSLPSRRLQYEFALAGLQSPVVTLAPGAATEIVFFARFLEDHRAASSASDLALLREIAGTKPGISSARPQPASSAIVQPTGSLFTTASWAHGAPPGEGDWAVWFPGGRRHEERASDGTLLSFFQEDATHVVSRAKEAAIARPHGHILRSGDALWFDEKHFGLTCYAAGIFAAQAYLGHPSFARLLSVVRNALNVTRGSGQRVFVRKHTDVSWRQLGVPSIFAMTPGSARWIYRLDGDTLEARVSCATSLSVAALRLRVLAGEPHEFLVSHELVLGATEYEFPLTLEIHDSEHWLGGRPPAASLVGQHQPGVCFAIATGDSASPATLAGDGLLHADGVDRGGPYATIKSPLTRDFSVFLLGTTEGPQALPAAVAAARAYFGRDYIDARPPRAPVRLAGETDAARGRIDTVLPWFTHNAAIHFSAPHGLEQYGGAAWGVRDVCQGSVEWLLAAGEFAVVRRILEVVFAQQYPTDGSWPQWFMFPPYRFIQQAHSHGDVSFWPIKALCDYLKASNDLDFLKARIGYTDPKTFTPTEPAETVLAHCQRVIAQCESRFVSGTALVNYGDGDWDDTLQPADPAMRTRMVSAWTVALTFQAFSQLAEVSRRAGEHVIAGKLTKMCEAIRRDFVARLMPKGIVAGFLIAEPDGTARPLLHPDDAVTRIRYRLLPMTRSILAGLFTLEEAQRHLRIIDADLSYPDGVRLMSEPSPYNGGVEKIFRRAETAANVGREIGLQYVHAHLRYAEALARVGNAAGLWAALQVINPVALKAILPNAASRQSNMYFSSSDADFDDRYQAQREWQKLRTGEVAVRGGWRLYSSGPGLFIHKIRSCLLGLRESFDDFVFDPVLPLALDGLVAHVRICGREVEVRYRVREHVSTPRAITINGTPQVLSRFEPNPYRRGGAALPLADVRAALDADLNVIEIEL